MFTCDVIKARKVKHFDVSNVIYHKFSHGAVSYTLNGESVNVTLEFSVDLNFLEIMFIHLFMVTE